jgi:UDP-GlcNAc:undecaprenyl-phosphate GlcNAc-1-phosphate transferase
VTPLVGGLAVLPPVLAVALWVRAGLDGSPFVSSHLAWLAFTVGALLLTGIADDRLNLGPRLRLLFSLTVFSAVALYTPDFRVSFLLFEGWPLILMPGIWGIAFSVLCLAGLLNAVNMADGKNGIVISMSLVWALVLWLNAPRFLDPIFAAFAAALLVALAFNLRGKLFLGDGGSYGLSALCGLLAIYVYNHGFARFDAGQLALLFAVPVYDTLRLIVSRRLKGHSPFRADRDHLHHHIAYRFGWPLGLLVYMSLVIVPSAIALWQPRLAPVLLVLGVPVYAAALVLTVRRGDFEPEIVPRLANALRARSGSARRPSSRRGGA